MAEKKEDTTPQQHHDVHEMRTASDMHCQEFLESGIFSFLLFFFQFKAWRKHFYPFYRFLMVGFA